MTSQYSKFDIWKEYENIAMHFNELLMQLRLRALAATGLIVTVGGFLAKNSTDGFNWVLISFILFIVLLGWISTFVIDHFYYNKLLLGSVKAIVDLEAHEDGSTIPINISTKIQEQFPSRISGASIVAVNWFYGIIGVGIFTMLVFCLWQADFFKCWH